MQTITRQERPDPSPRLHLGQGDRKTVPKLTGDIPLIDVIEGGRQRNRFADLIGRGALLQPRQCRASGGGDLVISRTAEPYLVKTEVRPPGIARRVRVEPCLKLRLTRNDAFDLRCSQEFHLGTKSAPDDRVILIKAKSHRLKGYVMSDWGAVHSTEALLAGLDQQSGEIIDAKRWFSTELMPRLADGRIPVSAIDAAVRRILWAMYANGVDTTPRGKQTIDYEENSKVALQAAREGSVLLRNEGNLLPLSRSVRSIVVIGGKADLGVLSGGGSSQVVPVGGFRAVEKLDAGPAAIFARRAWGGAAPFDAIKRAFGNSDVVFVDGTDRAATVAAARTADIAIVFATKFSTEAEDHRDISLDGDQDTLIDAVADANPKTVVVLETGNPVSMPWLAKVPAILSAWYPGQRGGDAIAEILAGTVNPSGRLPVTFPARVEQLPNPVLPGSDLPPPTHEDKIKYGVNTNSPPFSITYPEGSDAGYRWFDRNSEKPLFAFGHGLSYTTFHYSDLRVRGGKTITASFKITNTGGREGADVPQLYIKRPGMVARLTPNYPVFAKRPILDCGFYDTLKKPNVSILSGALAEAYEDGVTLADGTRIECDVLLLSTGYELHFGRQFDIRGIGGKSLKEAFTPHPFSYEGMLITGFPNFVFMGAPYSYLVANHAVVSEQQVHYIVELLQWMVDDHLASFNVTPDATDAFVSDVDKELKKTAWVQCGSAHGYYRDVGTGGQKKVILAIPRHNSRIWHDLRNPRTQDFATTRKPGAALAQQREMDMLSI